MAPLSFSDSCRSSQNILELSWDKPPIGAFIVLEARPPLVLVVQESLEEASKLSQCVIICIFNGLSPRLVDFHKWISTVWDPISSDKKTIYPLARGFLIAQFISVEERNTIMDVGPWFLGNSRLFMEPWYPSFDPSSTVITSALAWVRLPNLLLHLQNSALLKAIGNSLGTFLNICPTTKDYLKTTFARICVKMDFNKGLPTKIHLVNEGYRWVQKLGFEKVLFHCRVCFEICHFAKSYPKAHNHRGHQKATWWDGAKFEHYIIFKSDSTTKNAETQEDQQNKATSPPKIEEEEA